MRVSSWKYMCKSETETNCDYGLNLGKPNRQNYFLDLTEVEVNIRGEMYSFSLERQSFWTTCPELRDKDHVKGGTPIRDMLEQLNSLTWKTGFPRHFQLKQIEGNKFKLFT